MQNNRIKTLELLLQLVKGAGTVMYGAAGKHHKTAATDFSHVHPQNPPTHPS